ncbi:receptor-like protein EIX2 [Bidens hawaiensis]|uniref:receptor-like protein EIX2 n=1 Tax=Bidens hawaiensis TaxID=980011 RepID=UPI0040496094
MKTLTLLPLCISSSCLWFLLISSLCSICFCNQNSDPVLCIPTERLALIYLKNNLTNHAYRLSSWVGEDCCTWSGVVCDNFTGHVHEIHLRGPDLINGLYDTIDEIEETRKQRLGGTISPSVIKLLQLRHLDLSCNDFGNGSIPAFTGSFQNLIHLNLSCSHFSGEVPHQLGNLSTLRVLDLHDCPNYINGYIFPPPNLEGLHSKSLAWLKNLKGLLYLDMGRTDLTYASDWFPVVNNLTSLEELHFSLCGLNLLPSNPTAGSFTSLIALDLSYNCFDSMLLPGWIFSLHNLAFLDLRFCGFSGVIPGTHGGFHNMPSLRTLILSGNTFVDSWFFLNRLSSLSNLRRLDLRRCYISSPILGNLQNLSFIEYVDLSENWIVEEIPKTLSNLCNITTLILSYNKFSGNVSELLERFCECESPKLEVLDFYHNYLIGQLPERLGKLSNLVIINFRQNNLTGTIPESIGRLSKLSYLNLDFNSLTGIVTESHFANLMALKTLSVLDNKLVFKLNVSNWIPPFKLKELSTRSCSFGPQFPSWIQTQTELEVLDLTNTNISDTIPNWFWTTFPNVDFLDISNNNIQGKLGDVISFAPYIYLNLSNNRLHGTLPDSFNTLELLDLSYNNLSGSLEQFLCSGIEKPRQLKILILANNNMSGVISDCWMNFPYLTILNLEKNQFSGIIPSSLGNNSSLRSLDIDDNRLSGNLPAWLLNSTSLVVIELVENELMGKIPSSIGRNNTSLRVLSLHSNKLEGKIPDEICHLSSLQILDLAHNDLSGNLPTCFINFSIMSGSEPTSLIEVYGNIILPTASLVTKGNTHLYSSILSLVTLLDLSDNRFSGSIPDELVGLLCLRFLNLSHNDLTGTIPNLFNKTGKLESLDLSVNHLNGNIPLSLSQLTSLSWLNVSYNNLVGRIPTGPQLQTFNESCFTGNTLCGDPLPACLQNNGDTEVTTDRHDEANGKDWILVIVTVVGLVVGFWIILAPLFISRQWRIAYYRSLEEIWLNLQDFIFLLFLRLTKRSI